MIDYGDGHISLEKGELVPFQCPKCKRAVEYKDDLEEVTCTNCNHIGTVEEFSHCAWEKMSTQ